MLRAFLILFLLKSFLFSDCSSYDKNKDKVTYYSGSSGFVEGLLYSETTPYNGRNIACFKKTQTELLEQFASCILITNPDHANYGTYKCNVIEYYKYIPNYQCPAGQDIINGVCTPIPECSAGQTYNSDTKSCECPPSDFEFLTDVTEEQCTLENPQFKAPNESLFYIESVEWDSCRGKCGYKKKFCPNKEIIVDGVCKLPPNPSSCGEGGLVSCSYPSVGGWDDNNNYIKTCGKKCYCLSAEYPTKTAANLISDIVVSCGDYDSNHEGVGSSDNNSSGGGGGDDGDDGGSTGGGSTNTASENVGGSYTDNNDSTGGGSFSFTGVATELTSKSQLEQLTLQSEIAIKSDKKLDDLNILVKNFSDTSTQNQVLANSKLDTGNSLLGSINNGIGTTNGLLTDIKGLIGTGSGTGGTGDSNGTGGTGNGAGTGDSNGTGGTGNGTGTGAGGNGYSEDGGQKGNREGIDNILSDAYSALNGIKSDFQSLKNKLTNGFSVPPISQGSEPTFCAVVFGKQICINLCDTFSIFSSIFYYMFVIIFSLTTLKLYYISFKMRF